MNPVARAVARHFARSPSRTLGVVVLAAVGVAVYGGTHAGVQRLEDTTAELYEELGLFDFDLRFATRAHDGLAGIADGIPGLASATLRYLAPAALDLPGGGHAAAVLLWTPQTPVEVGATRLIQGEGPRGSEVVVDVTFARDTGIAVGEQLVLRYGGQERPVTVRGLGVHPEFLLTSVDDHFTMPVRGTVAAVAVSADVVRRGDLLPVNSVAVRIEPGEDRARVETELRRRLAGKGVLGGHTIGRERQYSVVTHANRMRVFRDFLPAVLVTFDVLVLLLVAVLARRLTLGWRAEIGTLLALGVAPGRIVAGWVGGFGAVTAVGVAAGAVGALWLGDAVADLYQQGVGFPMLTAGTRFQPVLAAATLTLGVALPAAAWPLLPVLRQTPADLLRANPLRGTSPTARRLLGGLEAALGSRLPGPEARGLRNAVRRPKELLAAVATVAGGFVLAGSMYVFADAQERTLESFLSSRRWDAMVQLRVARPAGELDALLRSAGATSWSPMQARKGRILHREREVEQQVVALPVPCAHQSDEWLVRGRGLDGPGAAEALLNLRALLTLDAQLGDSVTMHVGGESREVEVVGVINGWTFDQAFVGPALFNDLSHAGPLRGALVKGGARLPDALAVHPEVARVVPGAAVAESGRRANGILVRMMRLYGHLGALTALFLVVATLRTMVHERAGEYALLRSLGQPPVSYARSLLVEVAVIGVLAGVLALPAVRIVTRIFRDRNLFAGVEVVLHNDAAAVAALLLGPALACALAVGPALAAVGRLDVPRLLRRR